MLTFSELPDACFRGAYEFLTLVFWSTLSVLSPTILSMYRNFTRWALSHVSDYLPAVISYFFAHSHDAKGYFQPSPGQLVTGHLAELALGLQLWHNEQLNRIDVPYKKLKLLFQHKPLKPFRGLKENELRRGYGLNAMVWREKGFHRCSRVAERELGACIRNLDSSESLHRVQWVCPCSQTVSTGPKNTDRTAGSAKSWDESSDISGALLLTENMKRMLFLTARCLWRKVKPWESKLLLWCFTSNTLKLEPESLWGDGTTTDWNRWATQESIGRPANKPTMKYWKYVISWRQRATEGR